VIDFICFVVIGFMVFSGWRKGALLSALSIGGLIIAYVSAYTFNESFGASIAEQYELPILIARPIAGFVIFMVVTTAFKVLSWIVEKWLKERRKEDDNAMLADQIGGAVLGGVWGAGVVLIFVGGMIFLKGMTGVGPNVEETLVAAPAKKMVTAVTYQMAEAATGNEALARTIAAATTRPQEIRDTIQQVTNDPRLKMLVQNPELRSALASGDFSALQGNAELLSMATDPEFLQGAQGLGLIEGMDANADPQAMTEQLAQNLGSMAKVMEQVSNDPQMQETLSDPEVAARLRSGDLSAILSDPKLSQLMQTLAGSLQTD